jgi:nucleoside-diphosphate-sugar epimerase
MNILITGGAGYVGSTVAGLLLEAGCRVRVLDSLAYGGHALLGLWAHPLFEFVRGDVRDAPVTREALRGIDAVVHLAAIVGDPACAKHPDDARSINHEASLALFEQCKGAGVGRFVFASTCSNYGKMKDPSQYVDEDSELAPVSLYAETKVAVEKVLLDPARTGAVCATPLRFATVFGVSPRMRFDLTVNEFSMEMLTTKRLVVFGEQFWRPYFHVRDAARAIAAVLQAGPEIVRNQVFNAGSTGQNYQKQQLVEMIQKHVPDAKVQYVHKDEDPRDYRVSFARIEHALGYRTTRSVEQGIVEVLELLRSGVIRDTGDAKYRNV